jgi:hypothetical protein
MNPDTPSYQWWIALAMIPAGMIAAIDATRVGISIPSMMEEATIEAYQDFFSASAFVSLLSILPGLLRHAAPKLRGKQANHHASQHDRDRGTWYEA